MRISAAAAAARVAHRYAYLGGDADAAPAVPSQSSTLRGVVSGVLNSCLCQLVRLLVGESGVKKS